jgi:hypothetical protein
MNHIWSSGETAVDEVISILYFIATAVRFLPAKQEVQKTGRRRKSNAISDPP